MRVSKNGPVQDSGVTCDTAGGYQPGQWWHWVTARVSREPGGIAREGRSRERELRAGARAFIAARGFN